MEKLTRKEEELMQWFWQRGPLFVRELVALYPDPKPHFNTLSTMTRSLEAKGYLSHNAYGTTYQYFPVVSAEEFRKGSLSNEEKISVEELKELIREIETHNER